MIKWYLCVVSGAALYCEWRPLLVGNFRDVFVGR